MRKKAAQAQQLCFTPESLAEDLRREAQIIGLPTKTTDVIVERVTKNTIKWLEGRPVITEADLNRKLAAEISKYNSDLAYAYQNRGKII